MQPLIDSKIDEEDDDPFKRLEWTFYVRLLFRAVMCNACTL